MKEQTDDGMYGSRNIVVSCDERGRGWWLLMSATVAFVMSVSLPPGLTRDSQLEYIETSSGGESDWLTFTSTRLYTNSFIFSPGPPRKVYHCSNLHSLRILKFALIQILLGYKKRGFGADL